MKNLLTILVVFIFLLSSFAQALTFSNKPVGSANNQADTAKSSYQILYKPAPAPQPKVDIPVLHKQQAIESVQNLDVKQPCDNCDQGVSTVFGVLEQNDIQPNQEYLKPSDLVMEDTSPYTVSIDGDDVVKNHERIADLQMQKMNIQTKYDDLRIEPKLNVIASHQKATPNTQIQFAMYSNYLLWLNKGEILIFEHDNAKPIITKQFEVGDVAKLTIPKTGEYDYVLRVHGFEGNYDETARKNITITERIDTKQDRYFKQSITSIYGRNATAKQNIELYGGTVTVFANQLQNAKKAYVFGQPIPMAGGSFVDEQIMPNGTHEVTIDIQKTNDEFVMIDRTIYLSDNDWFYVGLGELTIGKNYVEGPAQLVTGNDQFDENIYLNGRLGAYVKGKIKGKYILTAAINTDEEKLEYIFQNLDKKDPRQLLRRIDPDKYYPVYGDDSEVTEGAPTQGRFYIKLQRDASHVMWGNFRTRIADTEFAKIERGLYGGGLHYESTAQTSYGEKQYTIDAFIAEPGTVASRDEYRGTGGSLYLLRHQDITVGSEKVRIEVRDPTTNIVLQTTDLVANQDYDINYVQGRVMLSHPLPSTADDSHLVQAGPLSGNEVHLVAYYEYTPTFTNFDSFTTGGRAKAWLGDNIRVGVTAQNENTSGAKQELLAGDVTARYSNTTYIKAEVANTKGPWFGAIGSGDGGFNFSQVDQDRSQDADALSYRAEAALDLADVTDSVTGNLAGFYQDKEQGFSAPGHLTQYDTKQWGVTANIKPQDNITIQADYHSSDEVGGQTHQNANADIIYDFDDNYYVGAGLEYDKRGSNVITFSSTPVTDGERIDGAVRVGYKNSKNWDVYAFGQKTIRNTGTRKNNNRIGVGGNYVIDDQITIGAEVSGGSGGLGALASASYKYDKDSEFYLAYQLDGDSTNTGTSTTAALSGNRGTFTVGNRTRYSDTLSVYGEERTTHDKAQIRDLTHAYGVEYEPVDNFTVGATFEKGITDRGESGEIDRTSGSVNIGYADDDISAATSVEIRDEKSANEERITYLTRNNITVEMDDDWRALGKFNLARSNSNAGEFFDGDFIEGSLGFAYRPVDNDEFNALVKYTYLYDLPGSQQLSGTGLTPDYKQRSHILSADFIYDLTQWLSVGAKYGYKLGEITTSRTSNNFFDSQAQLGVLRADLHIVKRWDALAEVRALHIKEAQDLRIGALIAAYYHLDNNFKIGVGYNFADFNDDLTNLDYDAQGPFINIITKF